MPGMTDRGLPIVDGAPACPFVAFNDDRDARATAPDHRHSCYAEVRPAPRALAHQEAYCLSSAFAVCPTFQDWARREAARALEVAPQPPDPQAAVGPSPSDFAEDPGDPGLDSPHRNPPRSWAAPPPWMTGSASEPGDEDDDGSGSGPIPPAGGGGLSGSFADRLLAGATGPGVEPSRRFRAPEPEIDDDEEPLLVDDSPAPPRSVPPRPAPPRPIARAVPRDRVGRHDMSPEAGGPAWERPVRREAYPTLRTRVGLPSISLSPVLAGLGAVLLAAVALFSLPTLLGIGNSPAATSGPGGSPAASGAAASPTIPVITPVPEPTAQIYLVQKDDTMSRIANRFGVPLQVLIDANKAAIPNPDVLALGQEVIIPSVAPTSLPDSPVVTEAPSATP